jgi:hypothetical protein
MKPPMKPLVPGLELTTGVGVALGTGVGGSGVAVMGGGVGSGVGAGVGVAAGVGAIVGRGVAPDVTVTVGPTSVSSFPCATALNVTGHDPTGREVDPPNVPFEEEPAITLIGAVRPAAEAVTVAAEPWYWTVKVKVVAGVPLVGFTVGFDSVFRAPCTGAGAASTKRSVTAKTGAPSHRRVMECQGSRIAPPASRGD